MATYKVTGYKMAKGICISASAEFDTEAEAIIEQAKYPKSLKTGYHAIHPMQREKPVYYAVEIGADLKVSGVVGAVNETGIKRMKKFLGMVNWEYAQSPCSNFATEQDIRTALAI